MRLGAWVGICAALVNACSPGPLTSASEVGSISRHAPDALVTSEAGGSLVITFQLDDLPSADVQIEVTTTDPTEALTQPSTLIFATNNYSTPQEITVIGQDDPTDDGDADYALQFRVVSDDTRYAAVTIEDMSLSNVDDDTAGVTLTPSDGLRTHELGASDTFAVVLDTPPTRDVTVELDSSDKAEGTVAPNSVAFRAAYWATLPDPEMLTRLPLKLSSLALSISSTK